jgi:predicted acylesterase/phospholipase RssA
MLPYYLGCLKSLHALKLLKPGETHVGGCSAGSLAAVVATCAIPVDDVILCIREMMQDLRENGVYKRIGPIMKAQVYPRLLLEI